MGDCSRASHSAHEVSSAGALPTVAAWLIASVPMRHVLAAQRPAFTVAAPDLEPAAAEQVWFSSRPDLPALQVLHGRSSQRLWKVWHERYALCVLYACWDDARGRDGATLWRYRGKDFTTAPGELMLMEPGECHVTRAVFGLGDFDVFEIDPALVEQLAAEQGLPAPIHLRTACTGDAELVHCVEALALGTYLGEERLLQEQRLVRVVSLLLQRHTESRTPGVPRMTKVQVSRARDFIVANHATDFGISDLSAACSASASAICHGMPEALGVTPMELRTLVRVERARALLLHGTRPVDVAAVVGFCDQAKLSRKFKDLLGISPRAYADMMSKQSKRPQPTAAAQVAAKTS